MYGRLREAAVTIRLNTVRCFQFLKKKFAGCLFVLALLATLMLPPAASAALPQSPLLMQMPSPASSSSSDSSSLGWIWLDGYKVFQIAAPQSALAQRQQRIEDNLTAIRDEYLQMESPSLRVTTSQVDRFEPLSVYVNGSYLFTLTPEDARQQGMTLEAIEQLLDQKLPQVLERAYRERQVDYLQQQGLIAVGIIVMAIALAWSLGHWREELLSMGTQVLAGNRLNQLEPQQRRHLQDMQSRLLPLIQGLILVGTVLWIAGFFRRRDRCKMTF